MKEDDIKDMLNGFVESMTWVIWVVNLVNLVKIVTIKRVMEKIIILLILQSPRFLSEIPSFKDI